jgi:hypothetical protein
MRPILMDNTNILIIIKNIEIIIIIFGTL